VEREASEKEREFANPTVASRGSTICCRKASHSSRGCLDPTGGTGEGKNQCDREEGEDEERGEGNLLGEQEERGGKS